MKLDAAVHDANDLREQLELKLQENKSLAGSLESLKASHAELEVSDDALSHSCTPFLTTSAASALSILRLLESRAARVWLKAPKIWNVSARR